MPGFGPNPKDGFHFTRHNTLEGAACWVEHRGQWRAGVVVHGGRRSVSFMIVSLSTPTTYVRRAYRDLRRRVVEPRLEIVRRVER